MRAVPIAVLLELVVAGPGWGQEPKPAAPATSGPKWFNDLEDARQHAKGVKLDLLLAFTTADLAGLSAQLDTEVLALPEFQAEAQKSFLLVRFDLPLDESQLTAAQRKQNAGLRTKYPSSRLPAIWLCDSYGRPYAETGYVPGGPKPLLAWMEGRRQAGIAVTAAVMRAGPLRGIERAKALAEGLRLLDDQIVAANYHKEMLEIIQLDADGAAGLKAPFDAIARDAAARPLRLRMQEELQALREQKQWDELEAQIEQRRQKHQGERWAEQCLSFMQAVSRLEGRQDCPGALPLCESALALAPRSELAPEIDRLRQVAAAAVAEQQAREEAARKAEEAKKKAGKKK